MRGIDAEVAYLFRHALLREAGYQLQMPSGRARLHALAFETIEAICGGRPEEPPSLGAAGARPLAPHATDPFASELARHAELAGERGPALGIYLRRSLDELTRKARPEEARLLWTKLADLLTGLDQALAWLRAADCCCDVGRPQDASGFYERSMASARALRDPGLEADVLRARARLAWQTGAVERSERDFTAALAICSRTGDRARRGRTLADFAVILQQRGRVEEAEAAAREALGHFRACGLQHEEGMTLTNLGGHYRQTGRPEEARRVSEDALVLHRRLGARKFQGITLANLALYEYAAGRTAAAEAGLREAIGIFREVGDRRMEGVCLGNLCELLEQLGRRAEAEQGYLRTLEIQRDTRARSSEGIAQNRLANLYRRTGRLEHAERAFEEALAIHRDVGNRRYEGSCFCGMALLAVQRGDAAAAADAWKRGSGILREVRDTEALKELSQEMSAHCASHGLAPLE